MQDFLQVKRQNTQPGVGGARVVTVATPGGGAAPVEKQVQLRVLLPDKTVTTVTISEYWRATEVYEVCVCVCDGRGGNG